MMFSKQTGWLPQTASIIRSSDSLNISTDIPGKSIYEKDDDWNYSEPYRIKVLPGKDLSEGIEKRTRDSNGTSKDSFAIALEDPEKIFELPQLDPEVERRGLWEAEIAACDGSLTAIEYEQGILAAISGCSIFYQPEVCSNKYGRCPASIARFITPDSSEFSETPAVRIVEPGKEHSELSVEMRKLELELLDRATKQFHSDGIVMIDGPLFNMQHPGYEWIKKMRLKGNLMIGDVKNPRSTILTSSYADHYSEGLGDRLYFTKKLEGGERSPWFLVHSPNYDVALAYYKPRLMVPRARVSRVEVPIEQYHRRGQALRFVELGRRIQASLTHSYSEWIRKAEIVAKAILPSSDTLRKVFEQGVKNNGLITTVNQARYGGW